MGSSLGRFALLVLCKSGVPWTVYIAGMSELRCAMVFKATRLCAHLVVSEVVLIARVGARVRGTWHFRCKEAPDSIPHSIGSTQSTPLGSNQLTRYGTRGSKAGILDDFVGGPQSVLKLSKFCNRWQQRVPES